ncbi:uncharacterized protein LOC126770703 [Nymphalis io]|uniref:uncharacterized protein LOC126770703 n=1 Tax=Inachis io TaxID=171585 RepID=UPI00216A9DE8|nr:uncharacterized protein LOC126770703 [Nymphalis io]XP_050346170.1 uncharacterized protein LOC126770703 [Nymphalis io]XP_050346171.1 uncharacterized protein LOC126770703 [Nymphalis io]XP_050346172.1 uncharacterized protein LOC126770703 [Nymphalis io]
MALMYSPLAILILSHYLAEGNVLNLINSSSTPTVSILDPKRRNDIGGKAFSEQKDILLDMLEAKLKEVRDKKKKKTDQVENRNEAVETKCELQPNDIDLNIKANGIIAVGETDIRLKFGESGNSTLNLNATGISNVGKTQLRLGVSDGTIYIPGLNNLLRGTSDLRNPCDKKIKIRENENNNNEINLDDAPQFRRSIEFNNTPSLNDVNDILSTETTPDPLVINSTEESVTVALLSSDVSATGAVDE